jgi:hypothetical protein
MKITPGIPYLVSSCLNLAKYFRQQMANKVVLVTDKQLHIALLQRLMLCLSDSSGFWLWVVANLSYRAWPYFFPLPGSKSHFLMRYQGVGVPNFSSIKYRACHPAVTYRPAENRQFPPISSLGSNFNSQNNYFDYSINILCQECYVDANYSL